METSFLLDQLVIKRVLSRSQHLAVTMHLQATSDILVIGVGDFIIFIGRSSSPPMYGSRGGLLDLVETSVRNHKGT